MEIPGPGIESELQLWPVLQLQQHWILLNRLCWAGDWTGSSTATQADAVRFFTRVPQGELTIIYFLIKFNWNKHDHLIIHIACCWFHTAVVQLLANSGLAARCSDVSMRDKCWQEWKNCFNQKASNLGRRLTSDPKTTLKILLREKREVISDNPWDR